MSVWHRHKLQLRVSGQWVARHRRCNHKENWNAPRWWNLCIVSAPDTVRTLLYRTFALHVYQHNRSTTHRNCIVIRFYSCSDVAKIKDEKVTEDTVMTQVKTLVGNSWAQEKRELQQEKRKCDLSTKYPDASDSNASTPARPALNRSTSAQSDPGTPLPQDPTSPVASTSTSGIVWTARRR